MGRALTKTSLFFGLLPLLACKPVGVPNPPPKSQPSETHRPLSDFPAWTSAEQAGWSPLRLATYCVRLPQEVEPVCLLGKGVDRCTFVLHKNEATRFSITVLPPGLAFSRPEEFLLPDGKVVPAAQVRRADVNFEPSWEFRAQSGAREIHIAPEGTPFWLIVQYEGLSSTEELLADRVISTLLIAGRGPYSGDELVCPLGRKNAR